MAITILCGLRGVWCVFSAFRHQMIGMSLILKNTHNLDYASDEEKIQKIVEVETEDSFRFSEYVMLSQRWCAICVLAFLALLADVFIF